jgi:membrane protein
MAEGARRNGPPQLLRIATRTASGLQEIEPFDRAMTLAAQTFTSVFPLIIAVAALLPAGSQSLSDRLSDGLGLPDSSRAALELVLPAQPQTRGAFGVLGVVIVVFSATSLSRALARMYAKVWQVPLPPA